MNTVLQQKTDYLFGVLDKSGEGQLTEQDLKDLFAGLAKEGNEEKAKAANKAARRWWLILKLYGDTNRDNIIGRAEWQAWAEGVVEELQDTEEGSRSFQRWGDAVFAALRGDDETITAQEYSHWFNAFGLQGDAATSFSLLDANGNGTISLGEFKQRTLEYFKADNAEAAGNYLWGNPFSN